MDLKFGLSENITIKDIINNDLIMHNVDKLEVKNLELKSTLKLIKKFESLGKQGKEKLLILFYGYDDIPDEIYEIPEIRKFMQKLINKVPHLFYFISDFEQNKKLLTACISDIKVTSGLNKLTTMEYIKRGLIPQIHGPQILVQLKLSNEIKNLIINGIRTYGQKINDDVDDILEKIPGL